MTPYYTADNVKAAHALRYVWTGWPSNTDFPPEPDPDFFSTLASAWEKDDIRLLDYEWTKEKIRLLTSTMPSVSPVVLACRLKGRLQYHLRRAGAPTKFSGKFSVRSLGETRQATIESYVKNQVEKAQFEDHFKEYMEQFTVVNPDVDLSMPFSTCSAKYWYLLHLTLVVRNRTNIVDEEWLRTIRDGCFRIARARGHRVAALGTMPDHLHLALSGHVEQSPQEIALCYMNNLSYLLGFDAFWQPSYHVGTFGVYSMGAVRRRLADLRSHSPGG